MRKGPAVVLAGIASLVVAGAAVAASRDIHSMNVSMPDGSVAHILYHGDVAPKVRLELAPTEMPVLKGFDWPLSSFDRLSAELDRQATMMFRQAAELSQRPWQDGKTVQSLASINGLPDGAVEYYETITTTSNGSCTRTVHTTSTGQNQPPKVNASFSGNCATDSQRREPATSASWPSSSTPGGQPQPFTASIASRRT
jgi:hypothetical protein